MSIVQLLSEYKVEDLKLKTGKEDSKSDLGQNVWISEGGDYVTLQMSADFVETPFGASAGFGKTLANSLRRTMDIRSTTEMEDCITEIEDHLKDKVMADKNLFKKGKSKLEFQSLIKLAKDPKYDNTIRTKVNCRTVLVTNVDGEVVSVDDVKPRSSVKVICQLRNLWKKGNMYGPTLEVKQIMVQDEKPSNTIFKFF